MGTPLRFYEGAPFLRARGVGTVPRTPKQGLLIKGGCSDAMQEHSPLLLRVLRAYPFGCFAYCISWSINIATLQVLMTVVSSICAIFVTYIDSACLIPSVDALVRQVAFSCTVA